MNKILAVLLSLLSISNLVIGQTNLDETIIEQELLIEDYDYMLKMLVETPPLIYTSIDKTEFAEQTGKLRASIDRPLYTSEFNRIVLKTISLLNTKSILMIGDNGFNSHIESGGLAFPFIIKYLSGNIYIDENLSLNDTLERGTEIIAINDIPIHSIVKELTSYIRVRPNGSIAQQISYHWASLLWLNYGFNSEFRVSYIIPNDTKIHTSVVQGVNKRPKASKGSANNLNLRVDSERNVAVITMNRFYKGNDEFQTFLDRSFKEIRDNKIEDLIIDIRENHGLSISFIPALMDYLTNRSFVDFSAAIVKSTTETQECLTKHPAYVSALKEIRKDTDNYLNPILDAILKNESGRETKLINTYTTPSKSKKYRFSGNLYLLTSNETYSEATTFAAIIKDNKLGYIIGEETCNRACSYMLPIVTELPNTKINIQIPTTYTIRSAGYDDGRGVIPDFIVNPTYSDYLKRVDKVLNYTYWLIDNRSNLK